MFFGLNYIFSSNTVTETYNFNHKYSSVGGSRAEKTSSIILDNHTYENYPWFRFFLNFEKMKNKNQITYQFEKGLFGVRVLKSHEFSY